MVNSDGMIHSLFAALRDLWQHLQVLIGQQLLVGVALVNCVEHDVDGTRLALGLQPAGLPITLRTQNLRLLVTLGRKDLRLLHTLGRKNRGAAVSLGAICFSIES